MKARRTDQNDLLRAFLLNGEYYRFRCHCEASSQTGCGNLLADLSLFFRFVCSMYEVIE
jgi:hypothetical protein